MSDGASWLFLLMQVFFVDLLLGADNAVVIALACRRLLPRDRGRAVAIGAAGAIVLRLSMALFANSLLGVPLVKLIGAWTLVIIALNVRAQTHENFDAIESVASPNDFLSAAAVIMIADAAMSLDNVVALAAIAAGDIGLLAIGVLLSIPILAYGALILTRVIDRMPEILTAGAAFLGWVAGGMAVTDPLVAGWVQANAPALGAFAPALVALFVLAAGKGAQPERTHETRAPPTAAVFSPTPVAAAPQRRQGAASRSAAVSPPAPPAAGAPAEKEVAPALASESAAASVGGWTEERVVVAGFVLLAFLAGLIIFIASFFDSLT